MSGFIFLNLLDISLQIITGKQLSGQPLSKAEMSFPCCLRDCSVRPLWGLPSSMMSPFRQSLSHFLLRKQKGVGTILVSSGNHPELCPVRSTDLGPPDSPTWHQYNRFISSLIVLSSPQEFPALKTLSHSDRNFVLN